MRQQLSSILLRAGTRACGLSVFQKRKFLAEAQHWSETERAQWRLERLNRILRFAWDEVPFYRQFWGDHGVKSVQVDSLVELARFPVLTKAHVREAGEGMRPRSLQSIRHIRKCTGGSTSEPLRYLLDVEQWSLIEAFHQWGWEQAGYRIGDPVGVIAGGSLVPERMSWKSKVRSFAQRRLFLYGVSMDRATALDYHGRLADFGAKFLYGYPSVLYLFAKILHEENLALPRLKAIVTTAEMLLPHYRTGIESWLGCPIFNNFGSNDGGAQSYECARHDGFHHNDLQSIIETEGGEAGRRAGRLLITNLWNRSTPFIRYENGDLACLAVDPCPCGSPFPLIASVEGRTADLLTFANGQSLAGPALTLIFGDMELDGWQIAQTGGMALEVRLTGAEDVAERYRSTIERIIRHHVGAEVSLKVTRVAELTLTRGGKLKPVVNECGAQ